MVAKSRAWPAPAPHKMCLILFAWQSHPRYALVVAANRDEFHQRPSAAAQFWDDDPEILAGRDLQAGGTWLGVTRSGRFAAITNYREPPAPQLPLERSRGHLVRDFLRGEKTPLTHARDLASSGSSYRGFNLLLADSGALVYVSNRHDEVSNIAIGAHGLSNHLLDTDWPKVRSGRDRLHSLLEDERLEADDLFDLLTDRTLTPGEIPDELERGLAPEQLMKHYFIVSPVYGTRCSTVVLVGRDGSVQLHERQFDPQGQVMDKRSFCF
jgi:uncharacterized protein with NRDE domain